jgi:hypothetical protein
MTQSCVWTSISVEKLLNSSRLHPFGRHGNTSGCSSEFEKILVFLCRYGLGRKHAFDRTTGQHCPDAVLDKEIICRQFATVRTSGPHRLDAVLDKEITYRQFATVRTLGQQRLDAALKWKRMKCVMERRLHSSPSGRSMRP